MKLLRILAMIAVVHSACQAATYYVATTGNDSHAGSLAAPWLTIGHAASVATTGDTVFVENGTYNETIVPGHSGVIFQSQNKWGAAIQCTIGVTNCVNLAASSITIENFEIIGASDGSTPTGIKCNTGDACSIIGNKIHHIDTETTCLLGAAIEPNNGNNQIITGNFIYDVSPPRSAARCNHMQGIYSSTGTSSNANGIIENNIIVECYQCYAIQFDGGFPSGWTVTNNTIANVGQGAPNNAGGGIYFNCAGAGKTCDNNLFNNNIFYNTGGDSCITEATVAPGGTNGTHNSYANNLFSNCFGGNNFINGSLSGSVNADPLFVNYTGDQTGDYHLVANSGVVTVTLMNPAPVAPSVGDLATIWNPDDKTFAGQYTVCGSPTCSNPTTTAFQYQQPEDLLLWMSSSAANRIANHLTGTGNPHYSWMDADGQKFWAEKGSTGNPWDINVYNAQYIMHWITEDGDSASQAACIAAGYSSCFVDPYAYKRNLIPTPVMPRFMTQAQAITIDTAGNNTYSRTTNCELAGATDSLNLGPVHTVTSFSTVAWGGTIGTVLTLENDFYYGQSGGVYQDKEVFQYAKGIGLLQWTYYNWNGTTYVLNQQTTNTTTVSGGAPTPNFPCSPTLVTNGTWIGGTPGSGGNSALPTPIVNATSQNGVVNSLQAQSQITNMIASGCTAVSPVIGAACLVTVDFASNPNFSVNDRFDIANSTCIGCITLDPNSFNTTWYVASVTSNTSCSTCRITFNSYTEYLSSGAFSTTGTALHFNHILQDQVTCCMYTLEETAGGGDIIFGDTNQYHNYLIANAEIRSQINNTHLIGILVDFAPNGFAQTPIPAMSVAGCNGSPAQINCDEPVHVGIDRSYLHGYSFPVVARTADSVTVAVKMDCSYCYVTNSFIKDIHYDGAESHGIHVKSGVGPFKIVDNLIEGTTENYFYSYLPQVDGLPLGYYCDSEIRRNWFTGNRFEVMNADVKIPNGTGAYFSYLPKNRGEFKNACDALLDGNVFENSSGGPGEQNGTLVGNNGTSNNSNGVAPRLGSQLHDVTYTNNIYRHGYNVSYVAGRGNLGASDPQNFPTYHYAWSNNLVYDIGNVTIYGRAGWSGTAWEQSIADIVEVANRGQKYNCTGTSAASGGVTTATLTCTPQSTTCPPIVGQTTCGLGFQAGDWVEVSGCSDVKYNVGAPQQVPSLTSDPTLSNQVFQYNVPSAAGPSATGCIVDNSYGFPRNVTFQHNTVVEDFNFTNPSYANVYPGNQHGFGAEGIGGGYTVGVETMARDWWIQNNVFATQWPAGTIGSNANYFYCAPNQKEGTIAEQICWDSNSLVWTNNAISGNTPSKYTEYNSPAGVPGSNNGVSPPVTDLMALTNGCASTPDATCLGFVGNYSTNACGFLGCGNPANVADFAPLGFDYHQFALQAGSVFAAGNAHQGSDAATLGVNLTNLDNALGLQQYPGGNP